MNYQEILLKNKVEMFSLVKQIDISMIIEALMDMELTHTSLRKEVGNYLAKKIELGKLHELERRQKDAIDRTLIRYLLAELLSR